MCTPEKTPTEATAAAPRALQAAQAAAHAQRRDPHPSHRTLDAQGRNLAEALDALAELTATLTEQVGHYGDHRLLVDDAGADPTERLAIATGNLTQLGQSLTKARHHTDRYRNALDPPQRRHRPHPTWQPAQMTPHRDRKHRAAHPPKFRPTGAGKSLRTARPASGIQSTPRGVRISGRST